MALKLLVYSDGFKGRPMSSYRLGPCPEGPRAPAQKAPGPQGPILKKIDFIQSIFFPVLRHLACFLINYLFVFSIKWAPAPEGPSGPHIKKNDDFI